MKRIVVLSTVLCLAPLTLAARAPSAAPTSDALQTVQAFLTALSNADDDGLVGTLADDATVFMPTVDRATVARLVGKAAIRDGLRPFLDQLRQSGTEPPYMVLTPRDLLVQDLGDTAVVTFHLGRVPPDPIEERVNFSRRTFVLRRTDAGWRIAHFHGSNVTIEPSEASGAGRPREASDPHPRMQRTGLAEQRVRQLMTIWESGNSASLEEIASPDMVYDDVPNGERFEGLDGVRRYVGHVHAWASQVRITVVAVHGGRDGAVAEWVMRGVQDRPIPGRVPVATDRPFELKGATVVELREGRIVRAADYIDVLGFVAQLGGRVELPGGAVIPPGAEAVRQGDPPAGATRGR